VASRYAIAAVGNAMLALLRDARPGSDFASVQFALQQTDDLQKTLQGEGIGLYLYRVTINGARRNLPPRVDASGRRYRPSLPLDLYYLLVPWAASAESQQLLLAWAMRVLEDTPILPAGLLNHHGPEHDVFAAHEAVELICEPLSIPDMASLWDVVKPNVLAVSYVARLVAIDSDLEIADAPLVRQRGFDSGKGPLL
jgi:hypothetical protein